jgi:hypothetical protein
VKRLTLLLAPALLLAACDLSSVPTPPGPSGETVEWRNPDVSIVIDPTAEFMRVDLTEAAAKWSRAKYVDVEVLSAGAACPAGKVCPVMWGVDFGTPELRMGWGTCDWCRYHEDYGRMDARFDTRWPAGLSRKKGACHEMGHGLSLDHGNVDGPCQLTAWGGAQPTAWDLAVVDAIHDPQHAGRPR